MDSFSENIQISSEEAHMLHNAFQKEEFRKMFAEYIEEINDPDNIAKYEDEMTVLEKERGNDITFLKPESGYVIKLLEGGKKSFINICKNENVAVASCKNVLGPNEKMGWSWDIPMIFSKPRNMLDKKGSPCMVYDVMFNPNAFDVAKRVKGFRKIMEDSALTYVEKNFGVIFDKRAIKYPRMKYKGIPSRCVLRNKNKYGESTNDEWHETLERNSCDSMTSAKVFPNKLGAVDRNYSPFVKPKYVIKYREYADMSKYLSGCGINKKEMIIDIDVPLAHSATELEVDTSEKCAFVQSLVPAHNYKVEITFPYQVKDTDGKAEFNPKSKKLILTLPIIQPLKRIGDHSCRVESTELCNESSDVKPRATTELKAEHSVHSNECVSTKKQRNKECEMNAGHSTLDDNLYKEMPGLVLDIEGLVNADEKQNCNTSDFTCLQEEQESAGEVITTGSSLFLSKHSRCVVGNSDCRATEFCEFPLMSTSGVHASDISCEAHESHTDIIFKFQVKHVCPNSVKISFCSCSSSMEISYELLGSRCLPLKCVHRLSFGTNKKVWQNKTSISITIEDLSVEIKKKEECHFYWEKYWFGSNNKPMEVLHFSRKLQAMVGNSAFLCDMEEYDSEHRENDDHENCTFSTTSSESAITGIHNAESLDYSVPLQTFGTNALRDSDENALKTHDSSYEVIITNTESHNMEKQFRSSTAEGDAYSTQLMKIPVPQAALQTIDAVTSPPQKAGLKSIGCVNITNQESKVCGDFENCSVLCPINYTNVSEITEKLKPMTADIQSKLDFTGSTPLKDIDAPVYKESLNFMQNPNITYCGSSENVEVVSSSPCEGTLSEGQKANVKLIEEICGSSIDLDNDEKVAEVSFSDKRNNCKTTMVSDSHNSTSLIEEIDVVAHVLQELCDTLDLHCDKIPANIAQLSEVPSFNDAMHNSGSQNDCATFPNNTMKSDKTVDLSAVSVVPASKKSEDFDNKKSSKIALENIKKESLNSDDEEFSDNVRQPSACWGHEHHTSDVQPSTKTTKIGALFKNTIMFELD